MNQRYTDLHKLIRDASDFVVRNPGHLVSWADCVEERVFALQARLTRWEIHASDVSKYPIAMRELLTTTSGKRRLLDRINGTVRVGGRRYGNDDAWARLRDPDDVLPIPHRHACPKCYAHVPCEMDCYLEPDLEMDDGTPCGHHVVCDNCLKEEAS